jgi:tetratricopeptide (TPR) repeat protein
MTTAIEKIQKIIFIIGLVLLPVFFLTNFISAFDTPKLLLTFLVVGLIVLLEAVKVIFKGTLKFSVTNLDVRVILVALTYLILAIIKTPNKTEAFFQPGIATLFILATLLFFFANSFFGTEKKTVLNTLFFSGVVASLVSLLTISEILPKLSFLPSIVKNVDFNTFGGKLPQAIFLAVILPLGIAAFIESRSMVKKFFYGASLVVIGLVLSLSVYKMLFNKADKLSLPSYSTSWAIAIDSLKEDPFIGVGPANYLTAYSRFKPVTANSGPDWSLKYNGAKSFLLTVLTETGIIGLIIFSLLGYAALRFSLKHFKSEGIISKGVTISLAIAVLSFILLPTSLVLIIVFFILLSLTANKKEINLNLKFASDSGFTSRILPILIGAILIGAVAWTGFMQTKNTIAEFRFGKALVAVANNDVKNGYDTLSGAIKTNPKVDRYHASLSQIDIAIASSIAQKKELTESDKTLISQLIQEAIAQAKAAIVTNPTRSGNWENLGTIYKSIIPFAQGSDNFAIQTYTQAITLDPVNPNLRIALGSIFYSLGRYDEAISAFQLATYAKSDLANAHYNLSAAYREKGEIQKAIEEIKITLNLVEKDSADYKAVNAELESLTKKLPAKTAQATQTLTPPQEEAVKVIEPPIKLPNDANPPASE